MLLSLIDSTCLFLHFNTTSWEEEHTNVIVSDWLDPACSYTLILRAEKQNIPMLLSLIDWLTRPCLFLHFNTTSWEEEHTNVIVSDWLDPACSYTLILRAEKKNIPMLLSLIDSTLPVLTL